MKKFSLYLIPVLMIIAFVTVGFNTRAEAQTTTVCPAGYVCTPSTFICPVGYTCIPNNISTQNICPEGYICTQTNIPRKDNNSCAIFNVNMGLDSVGESVTNLQKFLDSKGLYNWDVYGASSREGAYDEATAQSVMEYQASQGLPTTGFVGPLTRGKINAELCGNGVANNTAKPTPTPSYTPTPVPATKIQPVVKTVITQTPTPVYTPTPTANVSYQSVNSDAYVRITSPVGGENWSFGNKYNITWKSSGYFENVYAYLNFANGKQCFIGANKSDVGHITVNLNDATCPNYYSGPNLTAGSYTVGLYADGWTVNTNLASKSGTITISGNVPSARAVTVMNSGKSAAVGTTLNATLLNTKYDKAGVWNNFIGGPNSNANYFGDWNWSMTLTIPNDTSVASISVIHNGISEAWSTSVADIYNKPPYPLVVVDENGVQINSRYGDSIPVKKGSHTFKLFGQIETQSFNGAKIEVVFNDGSSIFNYIPQEVGKTEYTKPQKDNTYPVQTPTPVYTPTPTTNVSYQSAVTGAPIIPAKKTVAITVLTPINSKNSSTIFAPGEKLNINWSSTEIGINKIVLESYDGLTVNVYQNPAYTAPYQRTDYSWTVPANIATGYYKIKVYSADAQSYGESSYFRIANNDIPLVNSTAKSSTSYGVNTPVLTVLTPMSQVTGGTYFQVGEKMIIQWSLSTAQEVRRIQLIPVNGGQKIDILDYTRPNISPAVMYSYVWTVPKTVPYARYFVYVQIGPDESISASGKSAQMVTIINPELIPTPTVTATPVPSSSPTGKTGKDSLSASVLDAVQGLFR